MFSFRWLEVLNNDSTMINAVIQLMSFNCRNDVQFKDCCYVDSQPLSFSRKCVHSLEEIILHASTVDSALLN